jgi:hypothetical protein
VLDGLVYVSDTFAHEIIVLNQDGELVASLGQRGTGDTEFDFPEGLASMSDGSMFIVDRGNNRLQSWHLTSDYSDLVIDAGIKTKFSNALKKF